MSLTVSSRPDKTVNGFTSVWNAAGGSLPVNYTLYSDLFPLNTVDSERSFTAVNDVVGYAELQMSSSIVGIYQAGSIITVTSTVTAYNGTFKVLRLTDTDKILIDLPYVSDTTGTVIQYYLNYQANIQVYLDGSLAGTKQVTPDANTFDFDIQDLLKEGLVSQPKSFYIDFFETYEKIKGTTITSSTVSDSANVLKAIYSTLQFQNQYGGNMFEYVVGNGQQAKWLTQFTEPVYFGVNSQWSIPLLSDDGTFTLTFDQYDITNTLVGSSTVNYSTTAGIVDVDFSNITLLEGVTKVTISGTEVETINVKIDGSTCN